MTVEDAEHVMRRMVKLRDDLGLTDEQAILAVLDELRSDDRDGEEDGG